MINKSEANLVSFKILLTRDNKIVTEFEHNICLNIMIFICLLSICIKQHVQKGFLIANIWGKDSVSLL